MRNFILILVLSIILVSFGFFFVNVYSKQKAYFASKENISPITASTPTPVPGIPSVYKDYTKTDFDNALAEKRVMVLFFTANWCKECLNQGIVNEEAFMELTTEGVVGLSIHILDSETTTETDAISRKFDVTKESSFVILDKNGKVNSKYTGSITKELLIEKIRSAKGVE